MSGGRVGSEALPSTAALEAWLSSLKSRTLHERLVEDLGGAPWSHHYEEAQWLERVRKLAEELYADREVLHAELDWLNSSEARLWRKSPDQVSRMRAN